MVSETVSIWGWCGDFLSPMISQSPLLAPREGIYGRQVLSSVCACWKMRDFRSSNAFSVIVFMSRWHILDPCRDSPENFGKHKQNLKPNLHQITVSSPGDENAKDRSAYQTVP